MATLRNCEPLTPARWDPGLRWRPGFHPSGADIMGKYVLAWILGVPAIVLVAIYFFAH
jgi:hypothetical protein